MRQNLLLVIIFNILLFTTILPSANADEADVGIIDKLISVPFNPTQVNILLESSSGSIRNYPAQFTLARIENIAPHKEDRYLIGAAIPKALVSDIGDPFYFVFFISDDNQNLATTPVHFLKKDALKRNSQTTQTILERVHFLESRIEIESGKLTSLEHELIPIRDKASEIANVNDIIDLNSQLTRLKIFGDENVQEIERLNRLLELGREIEEPENVNLLLQEVSQQLRDAAKVTAMADRLSKRQRHAAKSTMEQKLALIRKTQSVNREAVAKDILRLRKQRQELEKQFYNNGTQPEDQF
jgi:hypothetical protein